MKTLYIDCGMGAAGDMLTAALLELTEDPAETVKELNQLGIPGVEYVLEPSVKCGITGSHMHVLVNGEEEGEHMHDHHHHDHDHDHEHEHHHDHDHDHEHHHDHDHDHEHHHDHDHDNEHHHHHDHEHEHHHDHDHEHGIAHEAHDHEHTHSHEHGHSHSHSSMHGIEHIVMGHLHISDSVKKNVMSVYGLIAAAESQVHGMPVDQVHFHEVGSMDAVADVTAVCYLMEKLGVDQVIASPIHVGSGTVKCAHGILPVPAPATALILEGMPIYSRSEIRGELCTPTGAALLKNFVNTFGDMPVMRVQKIGYGMGKKDFPIANCVRVMLGETEGKKQEIYELNCNVDDMTGEEMSYAMKKIFEAGAVEVFTTAVGMKKSRPGTKITVITLPEKKDDVVRAMFAHTTTLGVREMVCGRHVMNRKIETVETPYGEVRRKVSSGYGVTRSKYEYDDLSALADANHLSIRDILDEIKK